MNNPVQNSKARELVLASKSPARAALLRQAGLDFVTCASQTDERALEADAELGPKELARHLAIAKGLAVSVIRPGGTVVAADQTLDLDGRALHKPQNLEEARDRLQALRGRTHHLHSAVSLTRGGVTLWSHVETAELTMRDFSDDECDRVLELEGGAVLQSVGAYRLEGPSIRLFEHIAGDYFTILGLPLLALLAALREFAPERL